jgi:putative restriction endonuclease
MQINTLSSASMIDACHITPFSETYDDSLQNGICLCPNLHRAFDRGLISISENYTILIRKRISERLDSPLNISQFKNKKILLPELTSNYPSLENLYYHRKKFEF